MLRPAIAGVGLVVSLGILAFSARDAQATRRLLSTCPYDAGQGIAGPCTKASDCPGPCTALVGAPGSACNFLPQYGRKCCVCFA